MKNMYNPRNKKLWGKFKNYKYIVEIYIYDF